MVRRKRALVEEVDLAMVMLVDQLLIVGLAVRVVSSG